MWVGKSCKDWVKDAVSSASSGHISLPSTESAPYDYMWSESSDPFYHVVGMSMPIKYVATGHIIQMRLKNGCPHTAIVLSNNGTSITFIESNWDSTPYNNNDAYVKVRPPITYQQFYSQLQSSGSFTVYYIQ